MDNSATLPGIKHVKKETPVGKILGKASLYLILLVGAVIFIFPFFWMISSSLMTLGETIIRKFVPAIPQWVNYKEAWTQANFSKYFINSVLVTLGTLTGLLFTSILAGYAFGRIDYDDDPRVSYADPELPAHPRYYHPTPRRHLDKHLLGTHGAIYGKRVQHLPFTTILRANPQRTLGCRTD